MVNPLKCSSCHKAVAGIHVLEVASQFEVTQSLHLCDNCATQLGILPNKINLQSLLGGGMLSGISAHLLGQSSGEAQPGFGPPGPVCPGCHLTSAEFKLRGRLGCPRCYEVFRTALVPLLERVHDASSHCGRFPSGTVRPPRPPVDLSALRHRLERAIATEQYEDAAQLRDQIQAAEDKRDRGPS